MTNTLLGTPDPDPEHIRVGHLEVTSVTASTITAGQIVSSDLIAGIITSVNIAAGAVTEARLAAQ